MARELPRYPFSLRFTYLSSLVEASVCRFGSFSESKTLLLRFLFFNEGENLIHQEWKTFLWVDVWQSFFFLCKKKCVKTFFVYGFF